MSGTSADGAVGDRRFEQRQALLQGLGRRGVAGEQDDRAAADSV